MRVPEFLRRKVEFERPRLLKSDDAGACSALHAFGFAYPWSAHEFESLLTDEACLAVGINSKARLVGYLFSRIASDEAEILTLVVEPALRGLGCGQRLLEDHFARLAARGAQVLFLEVDSENGAALVLYRRNGFIEVGVRKAYYTGANGGRHNAVVMRRDLA
jgi:ribosomal-protein-alanine N-acetyltransferase